MLTAQLVNRVLDEYHPGQPHLVNFTLSCVDKTTPEKEIANAAALRAAGYDIDDAEVSERTGWQVTAGVSSSELYAIRTAGYAPEQRAMENGGKRSQETPYTLNSRRRDAITTLALHRGTTLWEPGAPPPGGGGRPPPARYRRAPGTGHAGAASPLPG